MSVGDLPNIAYGSTFSSSYDAAARVGALNISNAGVYGQQALQNWEEPALYKEPDKAWFEKKIADINNQDQEEEMATAAVAAIAGRRLVRIIIADPDKNIPADQAILYNGDEIVTDLTDHELFYELDIKSMLDQHNEKRKLIKDKDKSGKDNVVYLEPTRVSKLTMVVIPIASI